MLGAALDLILSRSELVGPVLDDFGDLFVRDRAESIDYLRCLLLQQIACAIEQALTNNGSFLIDVVLEGDVRPEMIGVICGQ